MTDIASHVEQPKYLKIQELADLFRISRSTAHRLKREQQWPHLKFGTEIRFSQSNIAAIEAMLEQTPPPPKTVPNVGIRADRRKQRDA